MSERVIRERLVRGRAPGREFDIEFWQALGPSKIAAAAWDLVLTAASAKGIHEDQLRLQRSVEKLERGRSAIHEPVADIMDVVTIEIPEDLARSLERIASEHKMSVEQLAVERLRTMLDRPTSPPALLRALRILPHPSSFAVDDLEAAIAEGRLSLQDRGVFDRNSQH